MKNKENLRLSAALVVLLMFGAVNLVYAGGANQSGGSAGGANTNEGLLQESTRSSRAVDTTRRLTSTTGVRYPKLVVGLNADPMDLMPYGPNSQNKGQITKLIYDTLFTMEGDDYVLLAAKSYAETDPLHWRVEIWDSIYDTDGNHITADDVVFSYDWLISTGFINRYDTYGGVRKISEYVVEFTWKSPIDAIGELQFPLTLTFIFSRKAFNDHNFANDPVGSGPYKLASFTSGSGATLNARDDYWLAKVANIKSLRNGYRVTANVQTLQYDVITEAAQNTIALSANRIGLSQNVPVDDMPGFLSGGRYTDRYGAAVQPDSATGVLGFNQTRGRIGADKNFRLACAYAINNAACALVAGNFNPSKALGNPATYDYYTSFEDPSSYVNTVDLDAARRYLAQTNYKGERLQLLVLSTEMWRNIAIAIQAQLAQIGVNSEIRAVDNNMFDASAGDPSVWDFCVLYFGGSTLVGGFNRIITWGEFARGSSFGFYSDQRLVDLFKTASAIATHTEPNIGAMVKYMTDNVYVYPVANAFRYSVYTNDIATLVWAGDAPTTCMYNGCDFYLD
jgi:ABC-type transport system substrate-binding protein